MCLSRFARWLNRTINPSDYAEHETVAADATPQLLSEMIVATLREHPDDWSQCGGWHTIVHKSGVRVWVSNGCSHVGLWEPEADVFNQRQKKAIWDAYVIWRDKRKADTSAKAAADAMAQMVASVKDAA